MILSARQAKTMWCPQTTVSNCRAEECPMWKFWTPPPGTESEWARNHPPQTEDDKKGYCGLSGSY